MHFIISCARDEGTYVDQMKTEVLSFSKMYSLTRPVSWTTEMHAVEMIPSPIVQP